VAREKDNNPYPPFVNNNRTDNSPSTPNRR
jgi:hypothetical protein